MKRRAYLRSGAGALLAGALAGCLGSSASPGKLTPDGGEERDGWPCPDRTDVDAVLGAHRSAVSDRDVLSVVLRRGPPEDPAVRNEVVLDVDAGRLHQILKISDDVPGGSTPSLPPYYPGGAVVGEAETPPVVRVERYRESDALLADLRGEATFDVRRTAPDGSVTTRRTSVDCTLAPTAEYGCLGHVLRPFPGPVVETDALASGGTTVTAVRETIETVPAGGEAMLAAFDDSADCAYGYRVEGRPSESTPGGDGLVVGGTTTDTASGLIAVERESGLVRAGTYHVRRELQRGENLVADDLGVSIATSSPESDGVDVSDWHPASSETD